MGVITLGGTQVLNIKSTASGEIIINVPKVTVTYNSNEGSAPSFSTKEVIVGENYGSFPSTSRTGYNFAGWYTASSGGTRIFSTTTVSIAGNHTLYTQWDIKTYTVTFKDYDNSTLETQVVNYGANVTPPTQPTRIGHTFDGWDGTYTNVTSDRIIIATYNANTYTLTINYPTGITSVTVKRHGVSLSNGATIYHQDELDLTRVTTSGYSSTIQAVVMVTGNVATSNYITVSYALLTPVITYIGKTSFSMSFTVKNQNTQYSVRIYYKAGSAPTTSSYDGYVDLAANATSGTLTIGGLTPSTTYTIYASAYKSGSYSPSPYFTQTTDTAGPEWTYLGTSTIPYYQSTSLAGEGKCPSSTAAKDYITTIYPPQNYDAGRVMRVQCYPNSTFPMPPICATFYYEATIPAVKKWVYITWSSSYFPVEVHYMTGNITPADVLNDLEEIHPAANYAIGIMASVENDEGIFLLYEVQ